MEHGLSCPAARGILDLRSGQGLTRNGTWKLLLCKADSFFFFFLLFTSSVILFYFFIVVDLSYIEMNQPMVYFLYVESKKMVKRTY